MFETVVKARGAISGLSVANGNSPATATTCETKWIRWIPQYSGSVVIKAINEDNRVFNPNIAIYKRHDPTFLNSFVNSNGGNGVCSIELSGNNELVAGQAFTVCIDNLVLGRSRWFLSQIGEAPMPAPSFAVTNRLMTILPGGGSPSGVEIFFRVKQSGSSEPYDWAKYTFQIRLNSGQYTIQAIAAGEGFTYSRITEYQVNIS